MTSAVFDRETVRYLLTNVVGPLREFVTWRLLKFELLE